MLTALNEKINDNLLEICFYRTPYGYFRNRECFGIIAEDNTYGGVDKTSKILSKYFDFTSVYIWRDDFDNTVVGIKQSFPGTVPPKTFIDFKDDFHYRWDNRKELITIKRQVGSLDHDNIEKQIHALLKECVEFAFLYCPEHDKIKNIMV